MTMRGITKRIGSIKFSCVSPDEIRKMSATKIITADTYDDEGYPIEMGLMDPHMGVIEPGLRCKTCGCKVDECPGHFGHIDLAMPVIHVGFIKDIKMLLESTCSNCGRLMLSEDQIQARRDSMERMEELGGGTIDVKNFSKETAKDASGKGVCPYCGIDQVKIKLDKPTTFRETEDNHKLTPKEVRERLEKIPDEDLETLGIDPKTCRPEWMVLTALAVPPVTVRPSITLDSGDRSEDDLTHKLVDVLRINQRLRENRDAGAPQLIVEDLWELLQYHVTTYFDNQTSGIPPARHRSGRPLKTLTQRLKGKEGRFRSNLSGKRVNFSARTVISPDPMLSINQVGVPEAAARELTVPLRVNEHNIDVVRNLVRRGIDYHDENGKYLPGANYVIRADGRKIRVNNRNCEEVAEGLDIDYVVERQMMDGDVVLFNRQPSLHRMSMMAHRVRVMDGKTFRFNLCVCPPYNADFDGDEMNLHVLQSEEARAEARIIMQVQENILSPRYGGPIIGAIHDHITGVYFLTHQNPHFNRAEAMNILSKLEDIEIPEPKIDPITKEEYWDGRQLFSTVLPKDFRISFKANNAYGPYTEVVDEATAAAIRGTNNMVDSENSEYLDAVKKVFEFTEDADGNMLATADTSVVRIVGGQLVVGTVDVKAIGNSKGKILEKIARDYGSDAACKFINQVTRIALGALMNHGFSTGIDDEDIPDSAKLQIQTFNDKCIREVDDLILSFREGTLEQMPGRSLKETLEQKIMSKLSEAREEAGRIAEKHMGEDNPAAIMARCGARGNMLNLSQMAGSVGQQSVRNERIARGYWDRTLPHFEKGDLGAYARGFVTNSYKSGLSPTEFFFHAMGGREGLVDTAVRTSRSGYMQRRLVSALEDLKLMSDGSIRNTAGTVIQFKYGEDGVDPTRAVGGKSIDMDDLFTEALGADAEPYLTLDRKDMGDDYGSKDNDFADIGGIDDDDNIDVETDDSYDGE